MNTRASGTIRFNCTQTFTFMCSLLSFFSRSKYHLFEKEIYIQKYIYQISENYLFLEKYISLLLVFFEFYNIFFLLDFETGRKVNCWLPVCMLDSLSGATQSDYLCMSTRIARVWYVPFENYDFSEPLATCCGVIRVFTNYLVYYACCILRPITTPAFLRVRDGTC